MPRLQSDRIINLFYTTADRHLKPSLTPEDPGFFSRRIVRSRSNTGATGRAQTRVEVDLERDGRALQRGDGARRRMSAKHAPWFAPTRPATGDRRPAPTSNPPWPVVACGDSVYAR